MCVCTCVFLLHQESFNMILATNPSYQMGVSHRPTPLIRHNGRLCSTAALPRTPLHYAPTTLPRAPTAGHRHHMAAHSFGGPLCQPSTETMPAITTCH
jgi:hypothetical protein